MTLYYAYGLRIASDCPLHFPRAADGACDLSIVFAGVSTALAPPPSSRSLTRDGGDWCLTYADAARLYVAYRWDAAAARLTVSTNQGWAACDYPLTGVVMAVLLALSGNSVLHGAALALDDRAIVLLGDSGLGKSTLAAALVAHGARLLTDDVVRLLPRGAGYSVTAGVPRLSLGSEARDRLLARVAGAAVHADRHDRAKTLVEVPAAAREAPAAAIVILAPLGDQVVDPALTPLGPAAASVAIARNIYGKTWIRPLDNAHLADCAALAAAVPTYRLDRPMSLDRLDRACHLLIAAATAPPAGTR
jgi:hypothetical protein